MSQTFLIIFLVNVLILATLSMLIWREYRASGGTQGHPLFFYTTSIRRFLHGRLERVGFLCFVHFVTMHLLVPFLGFGLLLRSDINFLVILASLFYSMQLAQRIYPGTGVSEDKGAE